MPGFPAYHQLSELAQTHVHRVGDDIQPFHGHKSSQTFSGRVVLFICLHSDVYIISRRSSRSEVKFVDHCKYIGNPDVLTGLKISGWKRT